MRERYCHPHSRTEIIVKRSYVESSYRQSPSEIGLNSIAKILKKYETASSR